jgi:flavin-dependent dehydrogenase
MAETEQQVIIAGGGLAGLSCAIHLRMSGIQVTLIEKNTYPHHKVCGEYISNEVLPYLHFLGIDPFASGAVKISRMNLSSTLGKTVTCELPLGGFGLSRHALDYLLYQRALALGCLLLTDTVISVDFKDDVFEVSTGISGSLKAKLVIGAYGKRSALDQKLSRPFIRQKSPWLAVKCHYKGSFPDDLVGLHSFKGGYCGVSKVENGEINICYLSDYENFKKYRDIAGFEKQVLCKNPRLAVIFEKCEPVFEQPLSISQISFALKNPVDQHLLMIGDTAGLIHPLCGNGMAIAIHSAKICAGLSTAYFSGGISRTELETTYCAAWNKNFKRRMVTGRFLATVIRKQWLFDPLLNLLVKFPALLPFIVKQTHGQPI